MEEQWIKWQPVKDLPKNYYIDEVSDKKDGFKVLLFDDEKKRKILIIFSNSVDSYLKNDELFTYKTIDMLGEKYGKDFYIQWGFFKILNSKYLQRVSDESYGLSETRGFIHFSLLAIDCSLDIVSLYEPKVEFIE